MIREVAKLYLERAVARVIYGWTTGHQVHELAALSPETMPLLSVKKRCNTSTEQFRSRVLGSPRLFARVDDGRPRAKIIGSTRVTSQANG